MTRAVDDLLIARSREQEGRVGRSDVLAGVHAQIQDRLFGAPGDAARGLSARLTGLATAAEALATGPDEPGHAAALLVAAEDLARALGSAGDEVQTLRGEIDGRIAATVTAVNGSLAQLADLNVALTRNGATPELLDRRDAILADVAEQLDVAVTFGKEGTATVYTSGGVPLLDGGLRQLVYARATLVGPTTTFGAIRAFSADQLDPDSGQPLAGAIGGMLVSGGVRAKLPAELLADAVPDDSQRIVSPLRGGRLQGLLEARDSVLPILPTSSASWPT